MTANKLGLALCAGLLSVACVRDGHPRERASVTAVINEEVADDKTEQGKTRMHYTEVSKNDALGRDNPREGTIVDPNATAGDQRRIGTSEDAQACELAVYFDTDSTRLDVGAQQRLDHVAECMKRQQIDHATIVGQTDPSGSAEHNEELGLERARAVAEYLRERGVPDDQIRVRSKGELAATESQELWPVERRAGISVTPR